MTPTVQGKFNFTIKLSDALFTPGNYLDFADLEIDINPAIVNNSIPLKIKDVAYSANNTSSQAASDVINSSDANNNMTNSTSNSSSDNLSKGKSNSKNIANYIALASIILFVALSTFIYLNRKKHQTNN